MSFIQINNKVQNYSFIANRQQSQPQFNFKIKTKDNENVSGISNTKPVNGNSIFKNKTLSTQTSSNSFVNTPSDIPFNDKPNKFHTIGHSSYTMFKSQQINENSVQQLKDQLSTLNIQYELIKKDYQKDIQAVFVKKKKEYMFQLKKENEKLKADILMRDRIIILRDSEIQQIKVKLQTPQVYSKLQQLEERINDLIKENELLNELLEKQLYVKENKQLKSEIQKLKDSNQTDTQHYLQVIHNLQQQIAAIKPRRQSDSYNSPQLFNQIL